MGEKMTLRDVRDRLQHLSAAIGLPSAGRRTKADEARWSDELRQLAASVTAHLTQPAQAVDDEMALIPRHYASNIQVAACFMEQSSNVLDRREAPVLRKIAALLTAALPKHSNGAEGV